MPYLNARVSFLSSISLNEGHRIYSSVTLFLATWASCYSKLYVWKFWRGDFAVFFFIVNSILWGRIIRTTYSEGKIKKTPCLVSDMQRAGLTEWMFYVPEKSCICRSWYPLSERLVRILWYFDGYIFPFPSLFSPSRYLNKAFRIWSKKDKFSSAFINSVISHTDTEHSAPAWMLLSKITCSSPKLDYTKIMESWEKLSRFACL